MSNVVSIHEKQPFIRKGQLDDIPKIKELMEDSFGTFPGLENLFTKWVLDPNFSVQVCEFHRMLIGVSTCALKMDQNLSKYECFGAAAIHFLKDKKLVSIMNLVVHSEFRNQKIGTKLALSHLDWMKTTKCEAIFGTSWCNGTEQNSSFLFEKSGFQKISESNTFLRSQLIEGAICKVCKMKECNCNSILYISPVKDLYRRAKEEDKGGV